MKKTRIGLTFAAVTGFGIMTAAPALAAGPGGGDGWPPPPPPGEWQPYANCDAAAAEGVYNIPSTDPRYGTHLDRDMDGVGCDDPTKPIAA